MRRRHLRIAVVLTDENQRKFPNCRQVESFQKNTLIHRAFPKIGECHTVFFLQLSRESRARRVRDSSTHDCICAKQPYGWISKMHRAAFAFGATCCLTQHFSHGGTDTQSFCNCLSMAAIRTGHEIVFSQCPTTSHSSRFLPDTGM